jgi:hypothetical protein
MAFDPVIQSITPSHILPNGDYVVLPAPTARQRSFLLQQSLSRYGILQENLQQAAKKVSPTTDATDAGAEEKNEDHHDDFDTMQLDDDAIIENQQQSTPAKSSEKQKDELKVHPLARASAILQTDAIDEVNRAINLGSIRGDYFDMVNIVDPALELPSAAAASDPKKKEQAAAATTTVNNTDAAISSKSAITSSSDVQNKNSNAFDLQEEQRIKALYVLQHKRAQFHSAATVFRRHKRRLELSVVGQTRLDDRLRQLRQRQWRIVAPEHGVRALAHAARPTETVACDVALYGSHHGGDGGTETVRMGRQASHVPRFATVELDGNYNVKKDVKSWKRKLEDLENAMEIEEPDNSSSSRRIDQNDAVWTVAEPFAIHNPELGTFQADFDAKKSPMLSLQFEIEKPSTNFCQSALLKPISAVDGNASTDVQTADEQVLVALQHSLLCATLFESIRRELAPDTDDIGNVRTLNTQSDVWLTSESETHFLPPPSLLSGNKSSSGLSPLCVIHCHEGELKVQLDCEYTLKVKLVEAGDSNAPDGIDESLDLYGDGAGASSLSGTQTLQQLRILCRTLLIDAQERFHKHSLASAARARHREEQAKTRSAYARKETETSPLILQHCCALGSKTLMERRIRKTIRKINQWLQSSVQTDEQLHCEWLSLSMFDLQSHFSLKFLSWLVDICVSGDELTVTSTSALGDYQKVKFHSDSELELYIKMAIQKLLREAKTL